MGMAPIDLDLNSSMADLTRDDVVVDQGMASADTIRGAKKLKRMNSSAGNVAEREEIVTMSTERRRATKDISKISVPEFKSRSRRDRKKKKKKRRKDKMTRINPAVDMDEKDTTEEPTEVTPDDVVAFDASEAWDGTLNGLGIRRVETNVEKRLENHSRTLSDFLTHLKMERYLESLKENGFENTSDLKAATLEKLKQCGLNGLIASRLLLSVKRLYGGDNNAKVKLDNVGVQDAGLVKIGPSRRKRLNKSSSNEEVNDKALEERLARSRERRRLRRERTSEKISSGSDASPMASSRSSRLSSRSRRSPETEPASNVIEGKSKTSEEATEARSHRSRSRRKSRRERREKRESDSGSLKL